MLVPYHLNPPPPPTILRKLTEIEIPHILGNWFSSVWQETPPFMSFHGENLPPHKWPKSTPFPCEDGNMHVAPYTFEWKGGGVGMEGICHNHQDFKQKCAFCHIKQDYMYMYQFVCHLFVILCLKFVLCVMFFVVVLFLWQICHILYLCSVVYHF